jgi:peptidoglycan-associated lipoprotein
MKKNVLLLCIILGIAVIGCQQKRIVKPEQPPVQEQSVQKEQSSVSQKEPSQWQRDTTRKSQEEITEQTLAKAETSKESLRFKEESGLFQDVYFEYDAYDIRDDAKPVLQEIAAWLLKNGKTKLSVEGHCDERGTNEYNLALGDRRAKAVRDYLIALGIASGRVQMISYGEEKPLCAETTEACWTKNRRAHFVVLREAGK